MIRLVVFFYFSCMMIPGPAFCQADPSSEITDAFRKGNSAEIGKYFNEMVDLNIQEIKGSYSKTQASRIIKDFLISTPVNNVTVSKEGNYPDGSKYTMGTLSAGGKKFSLYFLLRKNNGEYRIFQLQIQPEK